MDQIIRVVTTAATVSAASLWLPFAPRSMQVVAQCTAECVRAVLEGSFSSQTRITRELFLYGVTVAVGLGSIRILYPAAFKIPVLVSTLLGTYVLGVLQMLICYAVSLVKAKVEEYAPRLEPYMSDYQLKTRERKIEELQANLKRAQDGTEVPQLNEQIDVLNTQLQETKEQVSAKTEEVEALQTQLKETKETESKQAAEIKALKNQAEEDAVLVELEQLLENLSTVDTENIGELEAWINEQKGELEAWINEQKSVFDDIETKLTARSRGALLQLENLQTEKQWKILRVNTQFVVGRLQKSIEAYEKKDPTRAWLKMLVLALCQTIKRALPEYSTKIKDTVMPLSKEEGDFEEGLWNQFSNLKKEAETAKIPCEEACNSLKKRVSDIKESLEENKKARKKTLETFTSCAKALEPKVKVNVPEGERHMAECDLKMLEDTINSYCKNRDALHDEIENGLREIEKLLEDVSKFLHKESYTSEVFI